MKHGLAFWNRIAFAALSGAALMVCADVHAQSSPAQTTELKEVLVTATRRDEDIQTTSISATVLSGELLQDKGVLNLTALQYAAPGITVADYGSANVFNIRGIGRSQVDIDVPSGVVIYRDGAPTLAGYFQNEPYFDIESIEVYRGPQGTFAGKSAAGGALFINTNDPELGGELSGSVDVGAGDYSAFEATGVINVPVSDTLALRFAYRHYERDHFYDSIIPDTGEPLGPALEDPEGGGFTGHPGEHNHHSFRGGLLWEPTDNFRALVKIDYHDLDFGGNPTSVYGEDPLGDLAQDADFAYTDESLRTVLDLKYKFANGVTLTSLTGYQDVQSVNNLDLNATLPLYYEFQSRIDANTYSEEINLISPSDQSVRWVTGIFWQRQDSELPDWEQGGFNFVGGGFPPTYPWATSPWNNVEEDTAIFAHVGFDLTDSVELQVGVRYSDYERQQFTHWVLSFAGSPPVEGNPGVIPWATAGGDRHKMNEQSTDGQVALNWTVNEQHYLYVLGSAGHITGGINIFPPFLLYDKMTVHNYEGGWKANWFNDQFRTQFTVYYEDFKDYQATFADTAVGGINFPTNRNADTTSHLSGFEFSGQARVGGFSLDFGAAYLDSELGTFIGVVDPFRTAPNNIVDLSGARSPFTPEWTGNIGIAYALPIASGYTLTPRFDVSYVSDAQAALWDSPRVTLEERTLVNAQLTLAPDSNKWSAVFWTTNAGDKRYVGGIQNNAALYYAAPPMQYGVRLKYNF